MMNIFGFPMSAFELAAVFGNGRLAILDDISIRGNDFDRVFGDLDDDAGCQLLRQAGACSAGIVTYASAREVEGGIEHAFKVWPDYRMWVERAFDEGSQLPVDLVAAWAKSYEREEATAPRPVPVDDIDYVAVEDLVWEAEDAYSNYKLRDTYAREDRLRDTGRVFEISMHDHHVDQLRWSGACVEGLLTYAYARTVEGGLVHALRTWPSHLEWLRNYVECWDACGYSYEPLPEDLECALRNHMYAPMRPQEASKERTW
jgi:hypothetical protein